MKLVQNNALLLVAVNIIAFISSTSSFKVLSPRKQLLDKLFENLDETIGPEGPVRIVFILSELTVWRFEGEVHSSFAIILSWKDPQLRWNPLNYSDIEKVDLSLQHNIWKPKLFQFTNNRDPTPILGSRKLKTRFEGTFVKYTGEVRTVFTTRIVTYCELSMDDWPKDVHYCNFHYIVKNTAEINNITYQIYGYENKEKENDVFDFTINVKREESKYLPDSNSTYYILLAMTIMSRGSRTADILVYPTILSVVVTPLLFWLHPQNSNRLIMLGVLALIQNYLLGVLGLAIQHSGNMAPKLGKYLGITLLVTVLCVLETIVNRLLLAMNTTPVWLHQMADKLLKIKFTQSLNLFPRDLPNTKLEDPDEEIARQAAATLNDGEEKKSKLLETFVSLIDNIAFGVIFILYSYYLTVLLSYCR